MRVPPPISQKMLWGEGEKIEAISGTKSKYYV